MDTQERANLSRRTFLQAGATATAAAGMASVPVVKGQEQGDAPKILTLRDLGKTGAKVTILNLGTFQSTGTDRLLRLAYASGVRVFDTADCYGTEPAFARWFQQQPEVRKEIFLVTKDHPKTPKDLIAQLDRRLDALQTDYIDLFFIHGLGGGYGADSVNWPKSQEFKETIEKIKKSGKAKFVGFSTHDPRRAEQIQAAAEGGFVDAIMLQYSAWLDKDAPLNKALDACYAKGIGLISMKQVAGQFSQYNDRPGFDPLEEIVRRAPDLIEKKNLKPYQALLHAIWTDERIATCCVSMRNTDQIRENVAAAEVYEPLKTAEIQQLRDACLAWGPTLCADCDGRCSVAAGTTASLGDLTRLLTYHQHYGARREARRQYAELPEHVRNWHGGDLSAARRACPNQLDFARLLADVDRHLASSLSRHDGRDLRYTGQR